MMAMKMAVVSIGLLLLLLGSTSEGCDFYVAAKQNFAMPLDYSLEPTDQLEWQYNKKNIFKRRGSTMLNGNEDDVYPNGSLKLRNVDLEKSGKYTPSVYIDGQSKGDLKTMELCVMEPVSQPQVTSECRETNVILTCKPKQSSPEVSYAWFQDNKAMSENVPSFKKPLNSVEKSLFKCHVSNRVSSLTSAPIKPSCQKKIQPVEETENSFFDLISENMWIIVGSGGGLVLLLIIIVIIFCIRNRRRKRRQVKEEEELRLDWSNSNPQHPHHSKHQPPNHHDQDSHHHHHHHQRQQQQQPAGHTGPRQHRSKQPCTHKQNQGPQGPQVPSHHSQPGGRRGTPAPKPPVEDDAEEHPPLPQPRRKVQKTAPKAPQD